MKFVVVRVPINNEPTLVYKMVWNLGKNALTHWGRVTQIRISKLTIIGSDNGLSPEQRQAIIWTNAGILLIEQTSVKF